MATPSQVNAVRSAIQATALGDPDLIARHFTPDAKLHVGGFLTGRSEYRGHEGIAQGVADMQRVMGESHEQIRIRSERFYTDGADDDVILALARLTVERASGDAFATEAAYLYRMRGDLVAEVRALPDHATGLTQLGEPVDAGP